MATPFPRTLRSLPQDGPWRDIVVVSLGLVMFCGWIAWAVWSQVPVYVATSEARLEVAAMTHPFDAPVSGRIAKLDLVLGRRVDVGDVLAELDVEPQRLELEQSRTRLEAIGPEVAAARDELAALGAAEADERAGTSASVAEAAARHREAMISASLAQQELDRAAKMKSEGLVSEAELSRLRSAREQRSAEADALRAAVGRIAALRRADAGDRLARRQALQRQISALEGEQLTTKAAIGRLEHEVQRRVLRASAAGELAEIAQITVGSVVREGDRLGAILPKGDLRAVADFVPTDALGRIHEGHRGHLRLDAFPWAQHGTVPVRVSRVASEVREGHVRVELVLEDRAGRLPLQHGLPGMVEIEVERASPIVLLLRAAGGVFDPVRRRTAPATAMPSATP